MPSASLKPKRRNKKTRKSGTNLVSLLSGIIQTLWIPGLLSSLRRVWFVIAVVRILIFTIPTPSIPWKILSICAQSALPAVRLLGNTTAAFRMIVLWMMVWTIQRSWMNLSTALLAILVGSRNTGAPIVVTIAPIWVMWEPANCGRWMCLKKFWMTPCGTMSIKK